MGIPRKTLVFEKKTILTFGTRIIKSKKSKLHLTVSKPKISDLAMWMMKQRGKEEA